MEFSAAPREFWVVAAACRWPLDAAQEELRRLASDPLDWASVLRTARRHRVVGLLHNALHALALPMPDDVSRQLAQQAATIARKNMAAARESVRLQQQFEGADIPLVMLKGVSLAEKLHGSIALRHARDIDLLVAPERTLDALHLLEADGYALVVPKRQMSERQRRAFIARDHQMELVRKSDGQRIELHWDLAQNPLLLGGLRPFANLQIVDVPGGLLRTLDDRDLFAYLCVHGASHFWFRLKWLADVEAFCAGRSQDEIAAFYHHADAVGAGVCAAHALLLCLTIFGLALPQVVLDQAQDRRVAWLMELARRDLLGQDPAAEPVRDAGQDLQDVAGRFLFGRGARFVLKQVAITLVAPADAIRWTMPSGFGFMYVVLRLPFWLWRRALPSRAAK